MKQTLKRILHPVRELAFRFVNVKVPSKINTGSIIAKAASMIAANRVEGDYLEFGVFAGASFSTSYLAIENAFKDYQRQLDYNTKEEAAETGQLWDKMRFFAFDSFQGLPKLETIDKKSKEFAEGKYACTENKFRENLSEAGIPLNKVVTVAGWFEETCTARTIRTHGIKKASIIHVDCDFYGSAKTVLEFVKPLLTNGTIIIFDDWYCFYGNPDLGEQKAFNEWKETMADWVFTEYQKEGPWRNSFIASKRETE